MNILWMARFAALRWVAVLCAFLISHHNPSTLFITEPYSLGTNKVVFIAQPKQYKYDRDKIREAHRWCRKKARKALASGNNIVVANTFVSEWEVTPYRKMGYAIEIIEATGHYKNVHGVPDEIVERMRQNFEVIGDQKHNK